MTQLELIKLLLTFIVQLCLFISAASIFYWLQKIAVLLNMPVEFADIYNDWIIIVAVIAGLLIVIRTPIDITFG
jgi:hypothetical protein